MATFNTTWIKRTIGNVLTKTFAIAHVKSTYYDYSNGTTLDDVLIETEDFDQSAVTESEISPVILTKINSVATQASNNFTLLNANKAESTDVYTREEVDNLISALKQECDWKEAVETFDDLATTYPDAEESWTVTVKDTNTIYRYDGTKWVDIYSLIKLATASNDGLMSKSDYSKLKGITVVNNTKDSDKSVKYATTAGSATKATQDGDGNNIVEAYQTKNDTSLETTDKTIVGAINEVNNELGSNLIDYSSRLPGRGLQYTNNGIIVDWDKGYAIDAITFEENTEYTLKDIKGTIVFYKSDDTMISYIPTESNGCLHGISPSGTSYVRLEIYYESTDPKMYATGLNHGVLKSNIELGQKAPASSIGDGSKNLCPQVIATNGGGITATINADGSIYTVGTSNAVYIRGTGFFKLRPGKYTLSGAPNGYPVGTQLDIYYSAGSLDNIFDRGSGMTFTLSEETSIYVRIRIPEGTTIDATWYPMIRRAEITDGTYVPYAPSNEELSSKIENINTDRSISIFLYSSDSSNKIGIELLSKGFSFANAPEVCLTDILANVSFKKLTKSLTTSNMYTTDDICGTIVSDIQYEGYKLVIRDSVTKEIIFILDYPMFILDYETVTFKL